MQLAVGVERLPTPREDFVTIGLVPHIPYDAILWRVVDVMQRHGQLHHAETGSQVAGIDGQLVDDVITKLFAQLGQLLNFQLAQVGGGLYFVKYLVCQFFHLVFTVAHTKDNGTTLSL